MVFHETGIPGAFLIEPERLSDERGFFARTWCRREWEERGLNPNLAQCSVSFNLERGTLRGMHYQKAPFEEAKLVRCTAGTIYDVLVDLRPASPAFKQWFGAKLTASNRSMLYIPEGCAHGFQTLEDESEVFYQISQTYQPDAAAGVRWDDPAFGIHWPLSVTCISPRDQTYPAFEPEPD
jgi:dTDP-4-dehydrorhamnose 3,5-epimerase